MEVLVSAALRSIVLAAVAWAAMAIARVKSPAVCHAVWTLVTAGMLALVAATATLPSVPVRIVGQSSRPAQRVLEIPSSSLPAALPARAPAPPPRPFPWAAVYTAGLLALSARLAYGYVLTRRLVRASKPIEAGLYESASISVPLTVGWLRPKILLPTGWDTWAPEKLEAVLVHERTHVRRADWAAAVLAGVNRCVFWFHPLAWWLEARLKVLAEQACDDASLPHVASRECYAEVLVEMAAAIRRGEGRVGWEAMAMARGVEVRMRVERILDESRQIFPAVTRRGWVLMAVCAVPLVYLAAVARPARVRAQDPPLSPAPAPVAQAVEVEPQDNRQLEAARAELARLEAQIAKFKSENMGRLPEQFQGNLAQLNNDQMALANANDTLGRQQQEMAMLRTQLQNLDHQKQYYASQETGSEKLKMLKTRIKDLQRQLERASEVYTPENPHIKRMQAQIAAWERERDVERAQDPLNQKMLLDLDDSMALVQAQMEKLNLSMDQKLKQVQELNRTITQYQQRSESAPDLEMRYAELMRSLGKARSQVEQLANQPAAATTGPGLISRRDPEYTPEARKASLQGKVELSVAVGADGVPGDIQVTHGLDAGLDQKAVECVKSWRFRPATRNGEAVTAFVIVEVPFRLQ